VDVVWGNGSASWQVPLKQLDGHTNVGWVLCEALLDTQQKLQTMARELRRFKTLCSSLRAEQVPHRRTSLETQTVIPSTSDKDKPQHLQEDCKHVLAIRHLLSQKNCEGCKNLQAPK
jgi:hypothetical protein